MSNDVQRCPTMSNVVQRCPTMSNDVQRCPTLSNDVEKPCFRSGKKLNQQKRTFAGTGDLELWPLNGPPGAQKRTRGKKSISKDPGRAPEKPLEPSHGRFCQKTDQKLDFWFGCHYALLASYLCVRGWV